ncbi:hypothetical protein PRK78_004875 [Emydomyces testavorans]|uniref:Uncharacterized protein n=1 Tax=Emydomyces testavorans TaxID=2070801 RepID=A0AAF0DJA5_9EURO|nr:hypothetical protein PRK78_004875 [Emydomyces testavorans]
MSGRALLGKCLHYTLIQLPGYDAEKVDKSDIEHLEAEWRILGDEDEAVLLGGSAATVSYKLSADEPHLPDILTDLFKELSVGSAIAIRLSRTGARFFVRAMLYLGWDTRGIAILPEDLNKSTDDSNKYFEYYYGLEFYTESDGTVKKLGFLSSALKSKQDPDSKE